MRDSVLPMFQILLTMNSFFPVDQTEAFTSFTVDCLKTIISLFPVQTISPAVAAPQRNPSLKIITKIAIKSNGHQ